MLVTARFESSELDRIRRFLSGVELAGYGVTREKLTEEELSTALRGVDILVLEFEPVTRRVLEAAGDLKLVGCCRTGPEASVDIQAASELGVPVLYTPGRNAVSVAEYTFALMISVARHLPEAHRLLRYTDELTGVDYGDAAADRLGATSEWSLDPRAPFNRFQGAELSGKTLGLVGFGAIGREIARRALAFDMRVAAFDPYVRPAEAAGAELLDLDELARRSDFLVMAAKVTPETVGLFSARHFALMKRTAYFINTARAALADYRALYACLEEGRIAGAGIDVYDEEPIRSDNPLRRLANVVLSPHLAGASFDIPRHHSRIMVDQLEAALGGRQPSFLKNPEVWPRRRA